MKPLGRFFQVTETLDFKKYFLDIEKIERYPLSFVIKSEESKEDLMTKLKSDALKTYVVKKVVDDYISCIEEIINIVSTDRYYLDFIRSSVEKLKNIPTYGYYYSEIAKAMMETHNRKELVDWLHRYRLKYFSVRKINVLLSKTEDMLGLILFGVNYLFIKDGFYIVPKSDWRMSINQ